MNLRATQAQVGDEALRLFTIYAPPQHAEGTVHRTKADALAAEDTETTMAGSAAPIAGH